MEKTVKVTVEMTQQEYEKYQKDMAAKAAAEKAKKDRETYKELVDEEISSAIPMLMELSGDIKAIKAKVLENFAQIMAFKSDVLKMTKDDQKSHSFTNSKGDMRVTIGQYVCDGWRDTVDNGVAKIKEAALAMIKDDETKALVNQLMRLLARDKEGNLRANKVIELRKMGEELNNEEILEGVRIVEESYIPTLTKKFIRAEYKDNNDGWKMIPLGMTEA